MAALTVAPATARLLPAPWVALGLAAWGLLSANGTGAAVMILLLEGIGRAPVKWDIAHRDFHRAADLTSVLFAVISAVQFSRYGVHGVYPILAVTPYAVFPLVLAQRASVAQSTPLSALFYSLRRRGDYAQRIDLEPHFLGLCLLAASTGRHPPWVYPAMCATLLLGVLVRARPRRYAWSRFGAALVLAVAIGALTTVALSGAQRWLEASFMYWFNQFPWSGSDPNSEVTAMGSIGRLKLSDQVRVRVTPGPEVSVPLLLQEASYDTFKLGTWSASGAAFAAVDKRPQGQAWDVAAAGSAPMPTIELTVRHASSLALLPLPRGTRVVASSEIAEIQRNRFGALLAEAPPGPLRLRATLAEPRITEPPPTASDLTVPAGYHDVLAEFGRAVGGPAAEPPAARAARIRAHFLTHFRYSLIQRDSGAWRTPLADFLLHSHRGHCEYFATGTVLALRMSGIPARYAVGYSVESYSELERAWIARARHAHAWALAWIDGRWQVVDSTPATWADLEEDIASRWQAVQDLFGWAWYRYQRASLADVQAWTAWLPWLVPPLAALLYWRLRRSPTAVAQARRRRGAVAAADTGPLAPLLAALAARGVRATTGETLARFLARAAPATSGGITRQDLVQDYYRWRYAPAGGDTVDAHALADAAMRFGAGLADAEAEAQPPELASASRNSRRSSVDSIERM